MTVTSLAPVKSKWCSRCGRSKPRSEYYVSMSATKDGLDSRCKPCRMAEAERAADRPSRVRKRGLNSKTRVEQRTRAEKIRAEDEMIAARIAGLTLVAIERRVSAEEREAMELTRFCNEVVALRLEGVPLAEAWDMANRDTDGLGKEDEPCAYTASTRGAK